MGYKKNLIYEDNFCAFFEIFKSDAILVQTKTKFIFGDNASLLESLMTFKYKILASSNEIPKLAIHWSEYILGLELRALGFIFLFNYKIQSDFVMFDWPALFTHSVFNSNTKNIIKSKLKSERYFSGATSIDNQVDNSSDNIKKSLFPCNHENLSCLPARKSASRNDLRMNEERWKVRKDEIIGLIIQSFLGKKTVPTPSAGGFYDRRLVFIEGFFEDKKFCADTIASFLKSDTKTYNFNKIIFDLNAFYLSILCQDSFLSCSAFLAPVLSHKRCSTKYGIRSMRFLALECGGILQSMDNVLIENSAKTRWIGGFDDVLLEGLLQLEEDEVCLGLLAFAL